MVVRTDKGLKFHTLGDGAEAILCHSSLGLGRFLFHRVTHRWAQQYQVATWDPRGVGDNRDLVPTMEDWVADAVDIMSVIDRPCHLVGVSLGSFVMARVATTGDVRIQTVALVSTSLGGSVPGAVEARAEQIQAQGMEAFAEQYCKETLTEFAPPEVRENLVREIADLDPARYIEMLRITYEEDNGSVFADVTQPTLVVVGTLDQRTPPSEAELAARVLPNSWLAVVLRAGHLVPLDQAKRLDEILQEFWQG